MQKNSRDDTLRPGERVREWLLAHRASDGDASARGRRMVRGALLWCIGYLLAATPLLFSVNPLPLALLGATSTGVGYALVGVLIGLWQSEMGGLGIVYAIAALAVVALRAVARLYFTPQRIGDPLPPEQMRTAYAAYFRLRLGSLLSHGEDEPSDPRPPTLPPLYDEPLRLRVATVLPCAFFVAFSLCVRGDFAYYDLYGAILLLLGAPLGTCLLAPALTDADSEHGSARWALSAALLLAAVAFCGRQLHVLGLSPVVVLCVVLTLGAVRRYGLLCAMAVAVVAGLAYDTMTVPLLAVLGVIYALLSPLLGAFSLVPTLLLGMIYTLLAGGVGMFWAIVPSLAVGVLLFSLPTHRHSQTGELAKEQRQHAAIRAEMLHQLTVEQQNNARQARQLARMASAFGSLGEVFSQLGERASRPDAFEARRLCHEVYDGYCPDCALREKCWSQAYEQTSQEIGELGASVCERGEADQMRVPDTLRKRCPHTADIVGELNYRLSRRRTDAAYRESNEMFARSYDTISCLLRDLLRKEGISGALTPHPRAGEIEGYLKEKGMHPNGVCITGEQRLCVHLLGLTPASLTVDAEELRTHLEKVLGVALSRPHFDGSDDGRITLHALPSLRADYVHRSVAARETELQGKVRRTVCGDTLRVFEGESGMFYALLCDGMGSGRAAAVTSGCSAVFLEKVLQAGVGIHTALRMLNHYLRSRSSDAAEESFSTVDLFCLDLYSGKGQFVKSGAAPAMILRGGRLYRLSSHTVPIGILHSIDAQMIPFDVQAGDHILLMSDGISDSVPHGANPDEADLSRCGADDWLTEFLSGEDAQALLDGENIDDSALLERLFSLARAHGSCDDMSVISIRIFDAREQ